MSDEIDVRITVAPGTDHAEILQAVALRVGECVELKSNGFGALIPDETTRRKRSTSPPDVEAIRSGNVPYTQDPDLIIDACNKIEATLALAKKVRAEHGDKYDDMLVRAGVGMHNRLGDMRTALNVSARLVNQTVTPELFRRQKEKLLAATRNLLHDVFDAPEKEAVQ